MPSPRLLPLLCGLCAAGLALSAPARTLTPTGPAAPEFEQALRAAQVPRAAVSVLVQEVGAGRTRLALNPDTPRNPASLTKLLTTFAALDQLGPAFTWQTPVWLAGRIRGSAEGGALEGDLHIQGRGDPQLTLERLGLLMQRLRQMGIAEIRGDIVLDQSAFATPEDAPGDFDNEPLRPYNARAQALLLNLNTVLYTFTPDAAQGVAWVSAEPALQGLRVDASVPLADGPCGDWRAALQAHSDDSARLHFAGRYPLACGERVWPLADPDARRYAARLLSTLWQQAGGRLGGQVREGPAPAGLPPSFELSSPPLAEVVRDINKHSNNVMAQQLLLTLALQGAGNTQIAQLTPATPEGGRAALREWLRQRLAVSPDAVVLDNGSGLSRHTRLSAALLARLLQVAWASPVMPELMASLPVMGRDGTLRRAQAGIGQAHLKTGSLSGVTGIAGYVLGASGKRYVLVALVNHANAGAARPALEALVQWVIADRAANAPAPRRPQRR